MLASLNRLSKSYASVLLDRFNLGDYGCTKTAKTFISVSFQMTRRDGALTMQVGTGIRYYRLQAVTFLFSCYCSIHIYT